MSIAALEKPARRIDEPFYALTKSTIDMVIAAKLNGSQSRVWLYLCSLDSFGDRYKKLPPMAVMLEKCQLSRAQFYRALARLEELELFSFKMHDIYARNLTGSRADDFVPNFLSEDDCLKNETVVSKMRQLSQKREFDYISTDPNKELSQSVRTHAREGEVEIELGENLDGTSVPISRTQTEPTSRGFTSLPETKKLSAQPKDHFKDRCSAAAVENFSSAVAEMLSNRLFIQWWSNRVSKTKFGSEELEMPASAYVKARIRKNPVQAQDMYEEFREEIAHRVDVANTRVASGASLQADEVEKLQAIAHQSDIPLQLSPPAPLPALSPQQNTSAPNSTSATAPTAPTNQNKQAYQSFDSSALPEAAAPPANFGDMVRALIGKKSAPKQERSQQNTPFDHYRSLMQSGVKSFRAEALQWAYSKEDVTVIHDDYGEPCDLKLSKE